MANEKSEEIEARINEVLEARKGQLPAICAKLEKAEQLLASSKEIEAKLLKVSERGVDEAAASEVAFSLEQIRSLAGRVIAQKHDLSELEAEFTRNTLNVGVSGAARTGKSTTLQHITGLSDLQIPSGDMNPVTAVRSEIYNSRRAEAVIFFKTEGDFINGYIGSHVANVNAYLPEKSKLSIRSLEGLKVSTLPDKLKGSVSVSATDSLKRLREAKRSVSSYEHLLGSGPMAVSLDDVRRYVTYPSAEEERADSAGGVPADRRYLAVQLAQVFCPFPNLGDAKVGLVDLPGLGEIGDSAAAVHLKGLEDKIDQVFLVMKPTKEKAFADAEVGCNLDLLQSIQPAVKRGDLIVVGINKDAAAGQDAADNLRAHFDAEINAGRTDPYRVVDYCAVEDEDVARMFGILLERLATLLPKMDRQKVEHCMADAKLAAYAAETASSICGSMDKILRTIPSSDRVMKNRIDGIERSVIGKLNDYADELEEAAQSDSDVFKLFVADAERIHDSVRQHIDGDLFLGSDKAWQERTASSKDYYNLYRDECKRIRYEIIDAYCGLDRFYGAHVSNFKIRVLDTLLRSCGLDAYFGFGADDGADERIATVAWALGSTLRDDDLDGALELLSNVKFDFRSNVFLQIEGHLSELANPCEEHKTGRYYPENKRETLGGSGQFPHKQEKLAEYLRHDATIANDAILDALKGEQDRFNKYLAISIDFFNNSLFGKDEDSFKQVVIRGLIREYKPWVLPETDDTSNAPIGKAAQGVKELCQSLLDL